MVRFWLVFWVRFWLVLVSFVFLGVFLVRFRWFWFVFGSLWLVVGLFFITFLQIS